MGRQDQGHRPGLGCAGCECNTRGPRGQWLAGTRDEARGGKKHGVLTVLCIAMRPTPPVDYLLCVVMVVRNVDQSCFCDHTPAHPPRPQVIENSKAWQKLRVRYKLTKRRWRLNRKRVAGGLTPVITNKVCGPGARVPKHCQHHLCTSWCVRNDGLCLPTGKQCDHQLCQGYFCCFRCRRYDVEQRQSWQQPTSSCNHLAHHSIMPYDITLARR